jgi:hypothetical protein
LPLTLHMVAPCFQEYAAVSGLVFAMLAQTDPRWTLTLVSDGLDPSLHALVEAVLIAHAAAAGAAEAAAAAADVEKKSRRRPLLLPDQRVRVLSTPRRHNDGGHSPRAAGLAALPSGDPGSWAVLSGGDNYYAPLFVESVLSAVAEEADTSQAVAAAMKGRHGRLGLVYWDFVLDRKGNDNLRARLRQTAANEEADEALNLTAGGDQRASWVIPVAMGDGGGIVPLAFATGDDLFSTALAFTHLHGLKEGGGCEVDGPDPDGLIASGECVARLLAAAMVVEQTAQPAGGALSPARGLSKIPDRYEGYVAAQLAQGNIDVGAFAFPTALGQQVGYNWRHHSADWAFLEELLKEAHAQNQTTRHVRRTLYVHN